MLGFFRRAHRFSRVFIHLRRELPSLEGIESAYVYGDWAARAKGGWRARPGDTVDLVVIGRVDDGALAAVCSDAGRRAELTVSPTVVSTEDWRSDATGFVRAVKAGRMLEIV